MFINTKDKKDIQNGNLHNIKIADILLITVRTLSIDRLADIFQ